MSCKSAIFTANTTEHVALNAVQTAVKRAAAVKELFGHIVNQSLGKNLTLRI